MVQIIETAMPETFDKNIDSSGRRVLMDGFRRQNSKKALKLWKMLVHLYLKYHHVCWILILSETFLLWLPKRFVSKLLKRILSEKHMMSF